MRDGHALGADNYLSICLPPHPSPNLIGENLSDALAGDLFQKPPENLRIDTRVSPSFSGITKTLQRSDIMVGVIRLHRFGHLSRLRLPAHASFKLVMLVHWVGIG